MQICLFGAYCYGDVDTLYEIWTNRTHNANQIIELTVHVKHFYEVVAEQKKIQHDWSFIAFRIEINEKNSFNS